jgi:hypothetical protein
MDESEIVGRTGLGFSNRATKRKASEFFDDNLDNIVESQDNSVKSYSRSSSSTHIPKAVNYVEDMQERVKSALNKTLASDSSIIIPSSSSSSKRQAIEEHITIINERLREAIEDENTFSIQSAYRSSPIKSNSTSIKADLTVNKAQTASKSSASYQDSSDNEVPIYKQIKNNDRIMAKYSGDGLFYPAVVQKAIHKGYPNATYDIKFDTYETIETVSWRDVYLGPVVSDDVVHASTDDRAAGNSNYLTTAAENNAGKATTVDVFGRDLSSHSQLTKEVSAKVQVNITESNLSILQRLFNPPGRPKPLLDKFENDEFANKDTYAKLKGKWKLVHS